MRKCLVLLRKPQREGFLIYEEMRKCLVIFEKVVPLIYDFAPNPFWFPRYFNSVQLRSYKFLHLYARCAFFCPYYSYSFLLIYFLYIAFPCIVIQDITCRNAPSRVYEVFFFLLLSRNISYQKRGKEEGTEGETIHILGDIRIHFLGNI